MTSSPIATAYGSYSLHTMTSPLPPAATVFSQSNVANDPLAVTSANDNGQGLVASGIASYFTTSIMKWAYLTVGILGISCNAFVIYVIARSRSLQQQPRNRLIMNQSVADMIGAFFLITITTRSTNTELQGLGGWLICTIWYSNALLWTCYVTSEYILVTLTIEVFMAIVYPVRHRNVITTRRLAVVVVVIWLCSTVYHFTYNMSTSQVVGGVCYTGKYWTTPTALPAYATVNFFLKLLFPAFVSAVCYTGMARSLKRSRIDNMTLVQNEDGIMSAGPVLGQSGTGNGTISGAMTTGTAAATAATAAPAVATATTATAAAATAYSVNVKARRNIYYTLSYTLLLHLVTWSGNQIEFVLYGFGYAINSATLAYQLPLLAIYTSNLINPIIYTIKYERFRKAVISAFPGFKRLHRDDTVTLPSKHLHSALASF